MPTRYGEMTKAMQGRWKKTWQGGAVFSPLRTAFDSSLFAVGQLCEKAQGLSALGRYSEQGLNDEIMEIAKEVVPVLRRADHTVEAVRSSLRSRREKLSLPTSEPGDTAGAILRAEMRTWLKSLPPSQVMAHLLDDRIDQRLLLAAVEVPAAMAGLTEEMRGTVVEHVLRHQYAPELTGLAELDEAVQLTNAAIEVALYQLRSVAGFGDSNPARFDAWMASASVEIDRAIAAEAEDKRLISPQPTESDYDAKIEAIFDEAFARALPGLYPDHPVNRDPP